MYELHRDIVTPPDDTVIWRYMDLEKLLALLGSSSLHLCRLDLLRDPWEGIWPPSVLEDGFRLPAGVDKVALVESLNSMRNSFYVSCWHENPCESAAFWDQYHGGRGLAIRSTIGRLKNADISKLPHYIGRVKYLNYHSGVSNISLRNSLTPAFLKRESFRHENEVRVLAWGLHQDGNIRQANEKEQVGEVSAEAYQPSESKKLCVDLGVLIDSVYLYPEAPAWLIEPIRELLSRFELPNIPVLRSELYDKGIV